MSNQRIVREIPPNQNHFLTPPKLKVCAYVRVSTGHSAQMDSLENQTEYYERKLKNSAEYKYVGIFSDAGISGAKEERPGFKAMMEKAKAGEIDLIFTKSISRFARNTIFLLNTVRKLKSWGVGVYFEEQKIHTLHAEGELMLTVLASIAEGERKSVCGNVRWAKQRRFQAGEVCISTNRLVGYEKDKDGNLIVNKEQAKVVRLIYKRYLEGNYCSAIAIELNELYSAFKDTPWNYDKISKILSDEKYIGDILLQKYYVNQSGKQKKNKGELPQYYIRNNHPAIISQKDWEAVQRLRQAKGKMYPFSKLLKCPYCGASLTHYKHRRWVYWICSTYMEYTKAVCIGIKIPERILLAIHQETPITEPMVVEEDKRVKGSKKRSKENYRLIPAAEYCKTRREI